MDFVANKELQITEMLESIGINNLKELFQDIPSHILLKKPKIDDGFSEYEGLLHMEDLANKNHYQYVDNYLGAGAYEHHIPALVAAICSKSEFLTSYTPYQAEASQGMLQATFEFQSAICALTGMDVANASVYDAASACAEAILMAFRCKPGRQKVLIAQTIHPHYRKVIEQYLDRGNCSSKPAMEIITIAAKENGLLDEKQLMEQLDDQTAAVLIQYPSFVGVIDDHKKIAFVVKQKGALHICCADPLLYALFASAKEMEADIAVGDCQTLGLPLQYGGPYAGYIACRNELLRQLPGRLVGETVDGQGRRGFVLTLQAREQHIRREKATSNICTNQSLAALASLVGLLWYGKEGIRLLALTNFQRTAYLKNKLSSFPEIKFLGEECFFNEFAFTLNRPEEEIIKQFRLKNIEPGLALGQFFPKWKGYFLVAVTETKSKEQLDRYIEVIKTILGQRNVG